MRLISLLMTAAMAAAAASSPVAGQQPDSQIDARSIEFMKAAEQQLAAGNFKAAEDDIETSLAVDPGAST